MASTKSEETHDWIHIICIAEELDGRTDGQSWDCRKDTTVTLQCWTFKTYTGIAVLLHTELERLLYQAKDALYT